MIMTVFALSVLLILLLLALVVVWPWLRPLPLQQDVLALNVKVFRERLAELEADQQHNGLQPDEYRAQKVELERQLLAVTAGQSQNAQPVPRLVVGMVFLWLPIFAIAAYWSLAKPKAVFDYWQAQDRQGVVAEQLLTGKISAPPDSASQERANQDGIALLQALQANVYANAHDAQRWLVLAQAYTAAEAVDPALQALARAHRLAPNDDKIGMIYAQMRFFSQQGQLDADAKAVVDAILQRNSDHEGALMLRAMASYRAQDYADALGWLQRLKALRVAHTTDSGNGAQAISQIDNAIQSAQQALSAQQQNQVQVALQLAPQFAQRVQPTDTLFVYARALTGAPMPYAAQKLPASALVDGRLSVTLSDATAMMPERTLSLAKQQGVALVVAARISRSGNPMPSSGDLESLPVPLTGQKQLDLHIDQVR